MKTLQFVKSSCNKLVKDFRVTCLFTGQYNIKGYDTIKDINKFTYWK